MHEVEQATWNCLNQIAQAVDPAREGWVIDAGLGNGDYYCEWFANLGYRALAIEPEPTEGARRACEGLRIPLVEAALSDTDGSLTLYHAPTRDLRSLEGAMWGGMTASREVACISLPTLLEQYQIGGVTVLKLDIEGGEPAALLSLPDVPRTALPMVISVEYGGEHAAYTQQGPWQASQQARVRAMFEMLRVLGYRAGVLIGAGDGLVLRPFENGLPRFEGSDNWGNAVLTRAPISQDTMIQHAEGVTA